MTKQQKQIWGLTLFGIFSLAPMVSVMMSLSSIRSAVLFDHEIHWTAEKTAHFSIPRLKPGFYELRMESSDSKWEPSLKLSWELKDKNSLNLQASNGESYEAALTRPLAKFQILEDTVGENDLQIQFFNTNPTKNGLRIKLAQDRDILLEKSSRQFAVVLAVSLVLSLLIWRPLFKAR